MVNAALELQKAGHRITLFTAHHDRKRCFEETRDGTLDVRVTGDFLPTHLGHRLRAPCAILRLLYVGFVSILGREQFDVIFCDLFAHVVPVLRRLSRAQILFYCHFPDSLLAPPGGRLYQWYRRPIDRLEEAGMARAHRILVNSHFTATQFHHTFPRLQGITPEVVYPGVDMVSYRDLGKSTKGPDTPLTVLSINRYERKKNLALALQALVLLRQQLPEQVFARVQLVFAGGYDQRLRDNRNTLQDLKNQAQTLGLMHQVSFLRSCSDRQRLALLRDCLCVVYTPENEHFGLVPVEAMAAGRPVIAVNSGGPLETIRHGETGLLCVPEPRAFANALSVLISDPNQAERMGQAGREHVTRCFSLAAFATRLEAIVQGSEQVSATRARVSLRG